MTPSELTEQGIKWLLDLGVPEARLPKFIFPVLIEQVAFAGEGSLAFCDLDGVIGLDIYVVRVSKDFPHIVWSMLAHEVGHYALQWSTKPDVTGIGDASDEQAADTVAAQVYPNFVHDRYNQKLVEAAFTLYLRETLVNAPETA